MRPSLSSASNPASAFSGLADPSAVCHNRPAKLHPYLVLRPDSLRPCAVRSASDTAIPSSLKIASIRQRRTRTLDLSAQPLIRPRSSSARKRVPTTSSAALHSSSCSIATSQSLPGIASDSPTSPDLTPKASDTSRFSSPSTNMSAKSPVKRSSMVGGISVADRAKVFQAESADSVSYKRPVLRQIRRSTDPSVQASSSKSSYLSLASSEASTSSSQAILAHDGYQESEVVIKHARRISISTPLHRRARSDASEIDPFVGHPSQDDASRPIVRTSSFAEIEQLTAQLEANRPRARSAANTARRGRASSVLMHSIAEENPQLRLSSSTETIRSLVPTSKASVPLQEDHVRFSVSPCLSEDGSIDWHHFVSANYGVRPSFDLYNPISITDLAFPISTRKHVYESKLCKPDSPTLNDEATWLEEELANCSGSSDEEDEADHHDSYAPHSTSMDEDEYMTPEGSPLLSPINILAPPSDDVEIMGLGIQDPSLLLPGHPFVRAQSDKSADSLLEQVAMHEACVRTLHTLSHDERDQATAIASAANNRQLGLPASTMPRRRSSLTGPANLQSLRAMASKGNFSATQVDSSALFGDDTYDGSVSPMADMGHGGSYSTDMNGVRRASAASFISTDSTVSADVSIGSHGSSLLFNAHLAAPGMHRRESADTTISTRRSSLASSYGNHEKAPVKPPRSPLRSHPVPLPALPQEDCDTPQPAQKAAATEQPRDLVRMQAMPLPPLPHEAVAETDKPRSSAESARARRRTTRRKKSTELPQLPARLDSLDAMVAAAPKETQLKEEFPQRLLGDWLNAQKDNEFARQHEQAHAPEHLLSVQPIPLHQRIHNKDGTTYLPGLGEIVPPSPDVTSVNLSLSPQDGIPVYPAARKRLGIEPSAPTMLSATSAFVASASSKASSTTTLKSKLSGRFARSSASTSSAKDDTSSKVERKTSESSLLLGRMRKSPANGARQSFAAPAEMPSAWKDRIVGKRPSLDLRRPSLASLASNSSGGSKRSEVKDGRGSTMLPTTVGVERSRSSLGFRKMFSSITGGESTTPTESPKVTTLEALAANTFESPVRRSMSIRKQRAGYESFMQLSDDDEDEDSAVVQPSKAGASRKDLTKMFGASQVDLDQAVRR
ncbi:hypothetical protein PHBOTO_004401 [Pseudozyma hubeiensis]|nr:hypothetical protein PHBOTO_004401 [Pseudozyma hubeiensis]